MSGRQYGEASGQDSNTCVDSTVDGGNVVDESADAQVPDAMPCDSPVGFDVLNIDECLPPFTGSAIVSLGQVGAYQLNTDTGILLRPGGVIVPLPVTIISQPDGPSLFVWQTGGKFFLDDDSTLSIKGSRSLLLLSLGEIEIEGVIDVQQELTPSEVVVYCDEAEGVAGENGSPGSSGGAGGGFRTSGGAGGIAGLLSDSATAGAALNSKLVPLRGGCPGGNGGVFTVSNPARGGNGGGAIQLVSNLNIVIESTATISVGGKGGQGGTGGGIGSGSGGGGGGSGGGILLQSPSILVLGRLQANGGGGGGGAQLTVPGQSGADGSSAVAKGGIGGSEQSGDQGGIGGNGATQSAIATSGDDGVGRGAGGGGGGGTGIIRIEQED